MPNVQSTLRLVSKRAELTAARMSPLVQLIIQKYIRNKTSIKRSIMGLILLAMTYRIKNVLYGSNEKAKDKKSDKPGRVESP
ncbi:hypothetical protein K7432_016461 [Basidiobolus ranarum]|uniref:Uncharacterized protein n=1 Tax=Basidiobolus ranarum TaxID=34480 RepID=A0ABR2WEM7_9FUNG